MAYVPLNLQIFTAAFAGALAGMGASDRVITDPDSVDYDGLSSNAGAFAKAVDTAWGALPNAKQSTIASMKESCESIWFKRSPQYSAPFNNQTNYTALANAIVALVESGDNYLSSIGIVQVSL